MKDNEALDHIARLMSGSDWTPDTLDGIADAVRSTGRVIADTPTEDTQS